MFKNFDELINTVKKSDPKIIAVALAEDKDILNALEKARRDKIATAVLTGNTNRIKSLMAELNIDMHNYSIMQAADEKQAVAMAVKEVKENRAHVLMKGLCSTSVFLKGVLDKNNGLRSGQLLSHLALFESSNYHKLFMVTDAAMNITPDLNGKIAILNNAIKTAHKLGYQNPKVAVIAAVEKVNAEQMPSTADAALISKMNQRNQIKGAVVDGPLAMDNALSRLSCKIKSIDTEVGGDADILLVPDIETGNACYKLLTVIAKAKVAGIIIGAAVPIVLTSRADSDESKYLSVVTALQAC